MRKDWQEYRWGDIATLEYGKGLRGYEDAAGSFPVYGTNGQIGWHSEPLCSHPGVIIGRKGAYRGVHYSKKPFFVIDTAFYVEPKVQIDMRWAYYQLLTHDINSMDSGSAIPSTSRESFYKLPVLLPPLREQEVIAQILGTLDDKIELNRRMNETLEAMARALFKSWFVNFDPVRAKAEGRQPYGMDAETAALFPTSFQESSLGSIPQGWKACALGDVVEVGGGSTPSTKERAFWDGQIHWATPKDLSVLHSPILLDTERRITQVGLEQIGSRVYPEGTVLLSSRAPIGYLAISEIPVAVNQGMIAMVCARNPSSHYMLQWTRSNMDAIESRASGTTFQEISKGSFRSIPLMVPTDEVMRGFTERIEPLHQRMVNNLRESATLAAVRDALLPRLISGEIRVKDVNSTVEH
ncbi:MAG: restriction endonuclease subunit S [Acidobacteria bacterium]|nr:restriction endonuclease subunit S [Acidobacteriota bacterium]